MTRGVPSPELDSTQIELGYDIVPVSDVDRSNVLMGFICYKCKYAIPAAELEKHAATHD